MTDGVFRNSPILANLRAKCLAEYSGGPFWQENFTYDVMNVEAYQPGASFDISQVQQATGGTVTPRYYNVAVPAYIEKLKIEMSGKEAVFSYIDLLLQQAALTLSGRLANDIWRDGQSAGRTKYINGLDEALNDGSTSGFQGSSFSSYLTITRTDVNGALNSPMTGPSANIGGALSYPILEQAYTSCMYGAEMPDVMVTTNLGWSYMKMVFQPQQRFETVDPDFGFQMLKFNGAKVYADQYCPGTRTATTPDTKLGYSAVATGETLWFLNTKYIRFYVSTDPLFGFGFTGFLPAQNNSVVVGHYKFCGNLTVQAPRYQRYLFGITA